MTTWHAPTSGPIDATVTIPGSKSLTNRYLVLAALSENQVDIYNPLIARDTRLMADALRSLGVDILERNDAWTVTPRPLHAGKINCGLAGTVMRFIPPIAALAPGKTTIDGDPQARLRPMKTTIEALTQLGIKISSLTEPDSLGIGATLPLAIVGDPSVRGGRVQIDASSSSQFISALLLTGARFEDGIEILHIGDAVPSAPHISMTIDLLRKAGVTVSESSGHWRVSPGVIRQRDVVVEPDLSNAGPFLAAAMVTGGKVRIEHWPTSTTQPGDAYREIFTQMGAQCRLIAHYGTAPDHSTATLELNAGAKISGIDMNFHDIGELVPTVAAVACFAKETSRLRDIGQLRGHETDRLTALSTEITKLGAQAFVDGDDLVIIPANCHNRETKAAYLESYEDHRMATFAAIVGLRIPGVSVNNIETTSKTLPDFVQLWEGMLR
ncbi:3-phosphoshikimate 1-carboxyvinyltransferase [Arcanobacterium ihumii]|uniref:3-phosphoshikimate 1-carboxyvinyltransferase n=1 Tax=Arcanobacterium ihumii TaxID=2138162 RepID=UPI000F5246CA|nr:3-phosphoshikimate 1-carboxyvinyltransferase [Arcanobacterium ihumii]